MSTVNQIVFGPGQIIQLLKHNKDIVAGLYLMEDGQHFAAVEKWDEAHFEKHSCFEFLSRESIKNTKGLVEVAYSGFGFMLIKKGVFEKMNYPWFEPRKHTIGKMVDYSMEDVSFCLKARELGFKVHIDPTVIVGHEKRIVL